MKYRSEVDGLRAIAVIPVILFHAGFNFLSGGFLGVDIFFVISGYLITTILLAEMNDDKFSLVNFYERRARRILPALFLVMAASLPLAWIWLLPSDYIDFSESLAAVPLFSSNILFWSESGYFDAAAEMKPMLHTWSLAVEEQYYILFPLLLMALWSLRKRWIFFAIAGLFFASLFFAQRSAVDSPSFNFYMLPTRAWELMAGALVAFYLLYGKNHNELIQKNRWLSELLGCIGLGLITFSLTYYDDQLPLPSLYTLVPILGVVLIILFSSSNTMVGRLLGAKPMVAIGLISYSLYLWHQPIFALSRHRSLESQSDAQILVLIFLIFFLSYLTWRYIEKPFRAKGKIDRKGIFFFSAVGSLFFIAIGLVGYSSGGFKNRQFWYSNLLSYEFDNRKLRKESWSILKNVSGSKKYTLVDNISDHKLWFDLSGNKVRLLLLGDSHSKDLFNVLYNSKSVNEDYQLARYGVRLKDLHDSSHKFYTAENYLASDIVVLVGRYSHKDVKSLPVIIERLQKNGKKVVLVKRMFEFQYREENLKNLADFELSKKCVLSCDKIDAIEFQERVDSLYFASYLRGQRDNNLKINSEIESIASQFEVRILDRMDYVCDEERERCFSIGRELDKYFYDYGHHTLKGAEFFGERVDEIDWLEL
ncbi:acyltransferase family protein [Microbulbifer sp. EKSA005]|uniref:acyltransferase family protein n=1 Tax=Microbulbifer sp. EKSA005 TaxID=3243364 RepID=UPI00404253C0